MGYSRKWFLSRGDSTRLVKVRLLRLRYIILIKHNECLPLLANVAVDFF